jgi:hypothetical protein
MEKGYFAQLSDVQEQMMTPAERKNREFAYQGAKLAKAKAESKFYSSPLGVASKLPEAISDTTKRMGKGIVNYVKRLNPIPKGGFSPKVK